MRLEKKHPLAVRWFHWLNFPLLAIMTWSGLLIYWAHDVYRIGWGAFTLFKFFPESFYAFFRLEYRLAEGMAWHFFFMWAFAVNGVLYVLYTLLSGQWRYLVPNRRSFGEAWQIVLHDLRLSKKHPPRRKFNGAQQIAYTAVVLMGLGSLLTGLAIYKPVQVSWLTAALGGYELARAEHFALTIGFIGFFVIHVAQVARAGWNNFRAMVTGYEVACNGGIRWKSNGPTPTQPKTKSEGFRAEASFGQRLLPHQHTPVGVGSPARKRPMACLLHSEAVWNSMSGWQRVFFHQIDCRRRFLPSESSPCESTGS